jgi:hypothetical protein
MKALTKKQAVKKLKAPSLSKLKKKLWDVFSLYIRTRDNFTCFTCGKSKQSHPELVFQAGHLFSRIKTAIIYDEYNVNCQCYSCNTRHSSDPDIYRELFRQVYGQAKYDELYNKRNAVCKRSKNDIEMLTIHYQQKLKELQ